MRSPFLPALALAAAAVQAAPLTPVQLAAIQARGQDLAQRIRLEDAARARLAKAGTPAQALPSPVTWLAKDRWSAYFLGAPDASGRCPVLKAFAGPAGDLGALAEIEAGPLPQAVAAQARLLGGALRQLGAGAGDAYLVTVPEPDGASLYRMVRRTREGAVVLGQDFRLRHRPAAADPFTFTRFHLATWTLADAGIPGLPKGAKGVGIFHTHLDLADPCETDVAASILSGSLQVMVMAGEHMYACKPDGSLQATPPPEGAPRYEGHGGPAASETGKGLRAFAFSESALALENTWVVKPGSEPDTYLVECLYLDYQAGFTSQVGAAFTLDGDGRARLMPDFQQVSLKIRLQEDFKAAALLPGIQADLGLASPPPFLAGYLPKAVTPEIRLKRAWHLNHIGECGRALQVLLPLHQAQPDLQGLAFELAFAYNALDQSGKALPVLEAAARRQPSDPWIARELAYTYLHLDRAKEAVAAYQRSLALVAADNLEERSIQAMNLAQAYAKLQDTVNRDAWLAKAKAWAPPGSPVAKAFAGQQN